MADFISIKLREKLYDNIQNSLYHLKARSSLSGQTGLEKFCKWCFFNGAIILNMADVCSSLASDWLSHMSEACRWKC